MALKKNIQLDNGIILSYHRITSINKLTNISNIIEVSSYINEDERLKEKKYQSLQIKNIKSEEMTNDEKTQLQEGNNVFVETNYVNTDYNDVQTIEDAYNYLKTLEIFEQSEDC